MEFFSLIASKMQDGQQLNMTIRKNGDGLVLSMIPDTSGVKDKAVSSLEPLVMNGTPKEFEEGFESALAPIEKAFSLMEEVSAFEKSLEEARKKTEMEAKKKEEESKKRKEEADQRKSYLDHFNLAKELLGEQKFKDAHTVLAKALALPGADKDACEKLKREIDEKSGAGGLFGGAEDKSDGKKLSPVSSRTASPAPAKNEADEDEQDNDEE